MSNHDSRWTYPPDTGCSVAPKCLECPLPVCKYEVYGGLQAIERKMREEEMFASRAKEAEVILKAWGGIGAVIAEEAARWGVREADIIGRSRKVLICAARRRVAIRLRRAGLTLESIGRALGNRDHTTIISALKPAKRAA